MEDLFLNKEQLLAEWMRLKQYFASHDVIEYGLKIFYIRSDRTKRDFLKQGLIRKLTDFEKQSRGYNCKDSVYRWVGEQANEIHTY